ncbi:hypothetical protein Tco_1262478 [Tanacetum coccineum]
MVLGIPVISACFPIITVCFGYLTLTIILSSASVQLRTPFVTSGDASLTPMVSPYGPGPAMTDKDRNDGHVSIHDLNEPLTQIHSKTHEDLDLDELLSSF